MSSNWVYPYNIFVKRCLDFSQLVEVTNLEGLMFVPIVHRVGLIWFSKVKPVFKKM